jgi:cytochrome c oxidase cbb3-type subunit III
MGKTECSRQSNAAALHCVSSWRSQRGADAYRTYCSSCHGANGRGGSKASAILDGSYLALVSDQQLRTVVIADRPELGAPDWRGDDEDRRMSAQDISDVVAWLSSQRSKFLGQPYPTAAMSPPQGGPR